MTATAVVSYGPAEKYRPWLRLNGTFTQVTLYQYKLMPRLSPLQAVTDCVKMPTTSSVSLTVGPGAHVLTNKMHCFHRSLL